jgi:C1A family cysteine protease
MSFFFFTSAFGQFKNLPNPAAVYVEKMGYKYEVRITNNGDQYGVCIFPDGSEADAISFFKGKAGQQFSYCAKKGYQTESKKIDRGTYMEECAVCAQEDAKGQKVEISMLDLMEQNGEPLYEHIEKPVIPDQTEMKYDPNLPQYRDIPTSFDWRNYNGHHYIGDIRDQGNCGSCYSFGACANAEGVYNFATGLYDDNCVDLSESFIIWCMGRIAPYSNHFFGCDGADYTYYELQALVDTGTTYESYFPYTINDPGSCTHWGDPKINYDNWYRVGCSDITAIKTAIMTYGVVDAAVYVSTNFQNYSGGVFSDNQTSCSSSPCYYTPTNHAIALVGWGVDNGVDYWILRNSWGASWGESGYMRIAMTSARVACEVAYVTYTPPGTPTVSTNAATNIGTTTATLNGTVNPNGKATDYYFQYGTTSSYGNVTPTASAGSGNTGIPVSADITGLISGTTYHFRIVATNTSGTSYGNDLTFMTTCIAVTTFPYNEGFENGGSIPSCWSQEQVSSSGIWWIFITGNGSGHPSAAHTGTYNACLKDNTSASNKTILITPPLDLTSLSNPQLTFWHTQAYWSPDQDELRVYYKTSYLGSWTLLATYTNNITTWTQKTLSLPNPSATYYIGFEGNAKYGYGVCLDDVNVSSVTGGAPTATTNAATSITSSGATLNGTVNANNLTTTVTFEYGQTSSYGSTVNATPNTVTGNTNTAVSATITGLIANTLYHFRVKAVNSMGTTYGNDLTFTTLVYTCADNYEPNNTRATAKSISTGVEIFALINPSTDVDWFKFNNTSSKKNIKIEMYNLPADYDVQLYKSNGTLLKTSQNRGTTSELIIYNTSTVGTYYVKVYGYNGAYDPANCYTLKVSLKKTSWTKGSGIEETEGIVPQNFITVYPNPATGNVNVDFTTDHEGNVTLRLFDQIGKEVYEKEFSFIEGVNTYTIDLSQNPGGLYFLEMYDGNQRYTNKLLIE